MLFGAIGRKLAVSGRGIAPPRNFMPKSSRCLRSKPLTLYILYTFKIVNPLSSKQSAPYMKRIVTALLLWTVLVGGLALYMQRRTPVEAVEGFQPQAAKGLFGIEVTTSFNALPDPFALDTGDGGEGAALRLRVNGVEALTLREPVAAGTLIRVEKAPGMITGVNEFFVEASPPLEESDRAHAVRVRVFQNGESLAEETLWSEPGSRVAGTFTLELPESADEY